MRASGRIAPAAMRMRMRMRLMRKFPGPIFRMAAIEGIVSPPIVPNSLVRKGGPLELKLEFGYVPVWLLVIFLLIPVLQWRHGFVVR
jgi:hypothetical protein